MKGVTPNLFEKALAVAALAASAYLAYILFKYGVLEGYLDHIEPNMAIVAWRALQGEAIYQEYGARGMMINPYGPISYLIHTVVFAVFGGSAPLSKLAGSIAVLAGVLIFFLHARRSYGAIYAYAGAMMFIAFILMFTPYSIWNRPDPFIVLLVAMAVAVKNVSSQRLGPWTPHILIAVFIGLSVNLKAHSFIYFLPVVIDLCGWKGVRKMAFMALISVVVFLAPFALPQASLANYLQILLNQFSGRGMDINIFLATLRYSVFYLSPGLLLVGLLIRGRQLVQANDAIYFAVLCASVVVALYPASAPGQGNYHLLPLFPITIDAILRFSRGFSQTPRVQKGVLAVLAVLLLALSLPAQRRLMRNVNRIAGENVAAEVRQIIKRYEGETLQMGYGESFENYRFTYYKPVLAFAGHPVTVDPQAIMETSFVGLDIAKDFIADLQSCNPRHWLIPKGERPFQMKNYYSNRKLFGAAADVFLDRYHKAATYKYYDLWSCADAKR